MKYAKIRLYCQDLQTAAQEYVNILPAQWHYLHKVMRKRVGEQVNVFNAQLGEFTATITAQSGVLKLITQVRQPKPKQNKLALGFVPIKNPGSAFVVQKATELGVDIIYPIISQYAVVNKVNIEKLNLVAIEAAEQCGRLSLPVIHPLQTLTQFIDKFSQDGSLLLADESGNGKPMINCTLGQQDCILIGPEGGFSNEERIMLNKLSNSQFISLGENILRAETAAIAAVAMHQAINGNN